MIEQPRLKKKEKNTQLEQKLSGLKRQKQPLPLLKILKKLRRLQSGKIIFSQIAFYYLGGGIISDSLFVGVLRREADQKEKIVMARPVTIKIILFKVEEKPKSTVAINQMPNKPLSQFNVDVFIINSFFLQ